MAKGVVCAFPGRCGKKIVLGCKALHRGDPTDDWAHRTQWW